MPRRGRSDPDVGAGGGTVHTLNAAQHQGIAFRYLGEGANGRRVVEGSCTEGGKIAQSRVGTPGQSSTVSGVPGSLSYPCVAVSSTVVVERHGADASVPVARGVVRQR